MTGEEENTDLHRFLKAMTKFYHNSFTTAEENGLGEVEQQIESTVNRELSSLENSFAQGRYNLAIEELKNDPILFQQYRAAVEESDTKKIEEIYSTSPLMYSYYELLNRHLTVSENLPAPISQASQRLVSLCIPLLNSKIAHDTFNYKEVLPKIGVVAFQHAVAKEFLTDAIDGNFIAEDITPQSIIEETWVDRPYSHLQFIQKRVREEVINLPEDYLSHFPSVDWIVQQITFQLQLEIGLKKFIEADKFDAFIVGGVLSPLCLALMDIPRKNRPPIIYFSHGIEAGYQYFGFFLNADFYMARGERDKHQFLTNGVEQSKIALVGCEDEEGYPDFLTVSEKRVMCKRAVSVAQDRKLIIYAGTWDIYLNNKMSPNIVQEKLIEIFKELASKSKHKLTLCLKYHPHPTDDPYFSFGKWQYPLEEFMKLRQHGIDIRLIKELDVYLYASDCFIAHESSTLTRALSNSIPTLSIDSCKAKGHPVLGNIAIERTSCHKYVSIQDSVSSVSEQLNTLLNIPIELAYEESKLVWDSLYCCGRTEGLTRVSKVIKNAVEHYRRNQETVEDC